MSHPSFLALNRAALAGEGLAPHLEGCPACAAYLSRLQAAPPLPAWTAELADEEPRSRSWMGLLLGGVLAAGAVALMVHPRPSVTAKGAPSVAVYVKRGDAVLVWDGSAPLIPGDRIQLQVFPDFRRSATVIALSDPSSPRILYSGELPEGRPTQLPVSFRVDDSPGPEQILIVLGSSPAVLQDLPSIAASSGPSFWTLRLVLPKERR